jgi:hypothetical protein
MRTVAEKLPRHKRDEIAADDPLGVIAHVALARDYLSADASS